MDGKHHQIVNDINLETVIWTYNDAIKLRRIATVIIIRIMEYYFRASELIRNGN